MNEQKLINESKELFIDMKNFAETLMNSLDTFRVEDYDGWWYEAAKEMKHRVDKMIKKINRLEKLNEKKS